MKTYQLAGKELGLSGLSRNLGAKSQYSKLLSLSCLLVMVVLTWGRAVGQVQVNVLTAHNDIARTGQNLNETILTPSNVNTTQFGKLFSQHITGRLYAQPLYVAQVAIPNKGTHNVIYAATPSDQVYAFDADTNGGTNAAPLWGVSLLTNVPVAGTYNYNYGVEGTPVIDLSTNTMYLLSNESFVATGSQVTTYVARLHALNITNGAEQPGSPVQIQATIPGTGAASVGGMLTFDPHIHQQRPGLLLLHGVVYVAFGADGADNGPWHGWIFSFSESPLKQLNVLCLSANSQGGGVWMGESGLAAEVNNPAKPYGRMFLATGNGTYAASSPYTNTMSYGMSVLDIDLSGGQMTVEDEFTPYTEAALDAQDGDLGSGGPVLLPTQTMASGATLNPLIQIGKSGMIYILDRDNNADGSYNLLTNGYGPPGLGGFNAAADQVVQEVQTPTTAGNNWGAGVWGTEAYWNNNIYSGGTNPAAGTNIGFNTYDGSGNSLTAYSFVNGVLSSTPTSQSVEQYTFPGPIPSISANGATNGIVWVSNNSALIASGPEVLLAYDATNLAHTLYSSNTNPSRDAPGGAVEFVTPTIANGKVYVGAKTQISVYGLLGITPTAPVPVISPSPGPFTGTQTVTITDAIAGAIIYYTTDGSTPMYYSPVYSSANPIVVSSTETITAIASVNGYLQSAPASSTFTLTTSAANPVFSLAAGTYTGVQTLTITDSSPSPTIYYTLDGSTPTTASAVYSNPLSIPVSASLTVQAIAVSPGLIASSMVSATYTIQPAYQINFPQGFTLADGPIQFNGTTDLDDYRMQLTNGGVNQAGSAFYTTPVNIQSFTTNFGFQLSNPAGDGITFTIQNVGPTALGSSGGGLGYATIPNSVAVKFDLFNSGGEGVNSTGLYTNGAMPTVPAISMAGTGVDLHSGDEMEVQVTYDGTNLTMTITDFLTLATWSNSWPINISSAVGGNTAYVGFTGGTGTSTASQKFTYWTYLAGPPIVPNYPVGFDGAGMTLNGGAGWSGTRLRLTDGGANETRSAFFTTPVNLQQFSTSFDFQLANPNAEGITFTIQGEGPTALGGAGSNLGYGSIGDSIAITFDLYNDASQVSSDVTGMYTNGAAPTGSGTNLSSTGINLHSGDIFNAQLAYNGSVLTALIFDTATGASATQNYTVAIPTLVGGPTGYVGFTGSTSTLVATQDILNWTYSTTYTAPTTPAVTVPQISSVSANYGAPSATITLTGTNFGATQGASTVTFNGVSATASAWSNIGITVSAPSLASTGNLVVTVSGQPSNGVPFTVEPSTSITGISPASGPVGTTVTISGQNLLDAQNQGTVSFGGVSLSILNPSNTSLQVVVPTGAATGTFLVYTNGVGNSTSTFTVTVSPQISSVSANYGAPSATITLTGTNFGATQGASTVTFNGVSAAASAWSNTGITVSVPSPATTGNLMVTVSGQSSNGIPFTVEPAPSITGISPASGPVGATVTISGQNLLDAQNQVTVSFGGVSLSILNPSNTSLQVVVPTGAATGTFLVHTNGVGNSTSTFTVTVPQISSLSAHYGAPSATITLTGTNFGATQGASTVTFNGVSAAASAWSNIGITVSVPSLASTGNLVVTVSGQPSNGIPFTVEPAPSITGISPASGPPGTTVTISGQNLLDAQNQGTVSFGGVSLAMLNPSNTSLQVVVPTGAATGTFLVHTNGVGNFTSTFTVTVSPQISTVNANYGAPYTTIILTGTNFGATQGASTVTFNGVSATASAWSNTGITVTVPYTATTGNLVVTVSGQSSNGIPFTVEPAPSITGMSPTSGPSGTTVTITGQNLLDGEGHGTVWFGMSLPILNPSSTSLQVVVPAGAVTGTFDLHINGVGRYTSTFTVAAAPVPQITSVSPNYGAPYATITLTGTNFGATQGVSTVTFNGVSAIESAWSNTGITVNVPTLATTGNLVVTVSGQSSNGIPFTVEPKPSITGISPTSGPPGTTVTISGQNLLDAEGYGAVWFGGVSLPILNPSSTSIQVVVPAGAATGTFLVHTNGNGIYTSTFTVAGVPVPQIISVSPNYGAPSATVTLTGTNFGATQGVSTVTFNGAAATATAWSNTGITVSVPTTLATTGNLVVTVSGQSSNGIPFTAEPKPSITGISPTSGPPGTTVTISGQNLLDAEGNGLVWFGGKSLPILNPSSTSIQVVVPAGAATGTFLVHTNGNGIYTSTFTVAAAPGSPVPQITSVSPNYGAYYAIITLTGTNFGATQGASTVTFNGAAATATTAWSNTSITVRVPYHGSTGNLVVVAAGQSSNGIPFTMEPTASITGISPTSGPPGTTVTISGQNLVDAEGNGVIWFGGASLPLLNPSNTSIQVVVPAGAVTGTFNLHANGVGTYTSTFTVN
jgi:hypothetical protein